MLLGAWQNGAVVTFEDQMGTHGGLGGPQEKPFLLYPAELDLPSGAITSPCDLYTLFARYLDGEAEGDRSGLDETAPTDRTPARTFPGDSGYMAESSADRA
jgi:hypothetical protein